MAKRVYISADYAEGSGDRNVVEILNKWGNDDLHKVDFIDMAAVASGSVSSDPDCRTCDLKCEFNAQINASSAVIFVVGDKTALRKAGSQCRCKVDKGKYYCTPYKHNSSGQVVCKYTNVVPSNEDVGYINKYSYLRHEFEQAKKRQKKVIILYNSTRKERNWLPDYMSAYESLAEPFFINVNGEKIANYQHIKKELGF